MHIEQQQAILAIALMAAFADGAKHDRERDAIRRIAEALSSESGAPDLLRLYQDVLLRRTRLEQAVAVLDTPELRQLAYEMAVSVCQADDTESETEQAFLADLRNRLGLDVASARRIEGEIGHVTAWGEVAAAALPPAGAATAAGESPRPVAPDAGAQGDGTAPGSPAAGADYLALGANGAQGDGTAPDSPGRLPVPVSAPLVAVVPATDAADAELDQTILNYALIAGALELLPQSWASMAIVPLQVKLVYVVGRAHGQALDQGQIKEFIAAAGVGLTAQYLEQFGRKLLGGLLGRVAGKAFGKIGGAAGGMAFSFATTWALGQVARRYYAGGRQMDVALLRDSFQGLLEKAKQMQAQYLPQIEERARTLDMTQVMNLVRGR